MNDLFVRLGILGWKPWLSTLLLPPAPLLLLVLVGVALLLRRHARPAAPGVPALSLRRQALGWASLLAGLIGLWLASTTALSGLLVSALTQPPPPLNAAQRAGLRGAPHTAVLVLGAGRQMLAPEYDSADLRPLTEQRLRYGLWLARQTGLPVGYSGGLGHGTTDGGPTEAEVAGRIAERDFGVPLRWLEDQSRDTNENAQFSVRLLQADGIQTIVLVTHDFHQRRALAAFARAIRQQGAAMVVLPAPLGGRAAAALSLGDWLPTADGFALTRIALHEWLGWVAGA